MFEFARVLVTYVKNLVEPLLFTVNYYSTKGSMPSLTVLIVCTYITKLVSFQGYIACRNLEIVDLEERKKAAAVKSD